MSKHALDFYLNSPIEDVAKHALNSHAPDEAIAIMNCLNVRAYIANQQIAIANQESARWNSRLLILSFLISLGSLVVAIWK
jgi:hypothetical protein